MAERYPIRCDQGSTLVRTFRDTSWRGGILAVVNQVNPIVTVDRPHSLSVGDEVVIVGAIGSVGLNNTRLVPVWTVTTVPSATAFGVATDAPGAYVSGGFVAVPRDDTGHMARMQVRTSVEAAEAVLDLTDGAGTAVVAPAGSLVVHAVEVTVAAATTAAMAPGAYRYDLEIEGPTGVVRRLAEGSFLVRGEVTR